MVLALRINVISKGHSGITPLTLKRYIEGYNKNILPHIPAKGTVGASGDLAPLSHLCFGLMREGKVWCDVYNKYKESIEVL